MYFPYFPKTYYKDRQNAELKTHKMHERLCYKIIAHRPIFIFQQVGLLVYGKMELSRHFTTASQRSNRRTGHGIDFVFGY